MWSFFIMASQPDIQYISDADGNPTGVIVSIEYWRKIESELETAYLLKSNAMKTRLIEAKARQQGISLEDVRARLGV
jgi:PHD/YefM family antitoxin component YafN of YafNO toxin-antitoxin module